MKKHADTFLKESLMLPGLMWQVAIKDVSAVRYQFVKRLYGECEQQVG